MATYYWKGTTDGDWETQTNWDPNDSGYPDAGDEAVFYGTPTNSPDGANMSNDFSLAALRVMASYTGTIGSASTPFAMGATNIYIDGRNCGNIYLSSYDSGDELDNIYISDTKNNSTIYIKAAGAASYGTIGTLNVLKGRVDIGSGVTVTTFFIGYISDRIGDAVIDINNGATLPSTVRMSGGTVTNFASLTTLNMGAGVWTQGDEDGSTCGNLNNLYLYGGRFNWLAGNLANITHVYAGILDATKGPENRSIASGNFFGDAVIDLNNGIANITHSAAATIYSPDVIFRVAPGNKLQMTT